MITDAFGTPLNVGDKVYSLDMPRVYTGTVIRNDFYDDVVKILWETGARTWTDPAVLQSEHTDPTPGNNWDVTDPTIRYTPDFRTEDDV